jgi:hypothetical protein
MLVVRIIGCIRIDRAFAPDAAAASGRRAALAPALEAKACLIRVHPRSSVSRFFSASFASLR